MKRIVLIFFGLLTINLYGQTESSKTIPFIRIGYGYFNDKQMINGNILSGEVGIKMKNNYLFSLRINFADAINDIAQYPDIEGIEWNFIYSYKWISLNMGYEFMTKNRKNSFVPMMGPFYSNELTTYPISTDEGGIELCKDLRSIIGIDLSIQYLYNFKNGISAGLNASGCLAYQYGTSYFSLMPIISIKVP